MKSIVIFLVFCISATSIIAQNSDSRHVWIYFTDKGDNIEQKISDIEKTLPENALKRRAKLLKAGNLADYYDVPVEQLYIDSLLSAVSKVHTVSRWLNAVSAEVSAQNLIEIQQWSFVKDVKNVHSLSRANSEISVFEYTVNYFKSETYTDFDYGQSFGQLNMIEATKLHELGYTGQGVRVAVMDAGFNNLEHEAFAGLDIQAMYDFVNNDENVDDEDDLGYGGHGTKTLSALAAFKEGYLIGPAFGASFFLAKTENSYTETPVEENNWVAALEWAEYMPGGGPDVTSTSLGYFIYDDPYENYYTYDDMDGNTTVITIASDIAAAKGILVVNSAGNYGSQPRTISAPADGDSVLTVGAVDMNELITGFSSRGPTADDDRIKPDVCAQGSTVFLADVVENNYTTGAGTSFSCPLTAGVAALLVQAFPNASNMDIIHALKITASQAENPNNDYGWGIIRAQKAFTFLQNNFSEPIDIQQVYVFPNPTSGYLKFSEIMLGMSYTITNVIGQTVRQSVVNEYFSIDISEFDSGIYILNFQNGQTTEHVKVIKY